MTTDRGTINKLNKLTEYNELTEKLHNSKNKSFAPLQFEQASPESASSSQNKSKTFFSNKWETIKCDLFCNPEDLSIKASVNLDFGTDRAKRFNFKFKDKIVGNDSRLREMTYGINPNSDMSMYYAGKDCFTELWHKRNNMSHLAWNKAYMPFKKGNVVPYTLGILWILKADQYNFIQTRFWLNNDRIDITFEYDKGLTDDQRKRHCIATHYETTKGRTPASAWDPNSPDYYWR